MSASGRERGSRGFTRYDYDSLNSETFGSTTGSGDDWMAGHKAFVNTRTPTTSDTTSSSTEEETLSESARTSKLKELWPASPEQPSTPNNSIWSSPELPSCSSPSQQRAVIGSPSLPTGRKVLTVEELEKGYTTPSPPPPDAMPTNQPLAPPPGLRMPRPHVIPHHLIGQNPPMRLPPHFLLNPARQPGFPSFPLPPPRQNFRHPPPRQGPLYPTSAFHRPPPHPRMMAPPPHSPHWPLQQGDLAPRKSRRSEYLGEMKSDGSGFMTQKEKEWVIKIQLIQLQSTDPTNDDYYYMSYIRCKQSRNGLSTSSDQSNGQQILALPNIVHEERKYTPAEFSGALGKLSVLSLGAPRRRIDVGVAGGETGKEGGVEKKKQALIVIEKLYSMLLELEEEERKVLPLSEEERQSLVSQRDELRANMMALLEVRQESTKSELALFYQVISIRKGKRLIKRMLPLLSDDQAKAVLIALLRNVSSIIKKDSADQVLPELRLCVSAVVSTFDLSAVTSSLGALLEGGVSSGSGLVKIAQNEFGAQVLNDLLMRGATLSTMSDRHTHRNDLETWLSQCSELSGELLAHSDQLEPASPHTAALVSTLATLTHPT